MQTQATTPLSGDDKAHCALIQDLLPLYLEGEVTPASREIIESHLNGCEHCAGFLAGARSMQLQFQRDAQARHRVLAAKQDEQQMVALWRRGLALLANSLLYVGTLFGLMLLVGGLFLGPGINLGFAFGGGMLALVCFGWMASLLLRYGSLVGERLLLLLGSLATGIVSFMLFVALNTDRPFEPFLAFPSLGLAFLGLVGIWVLTWRATAEQRKPPVQPGWGARSAGQA